MNRATSGFKMSQVDESAFHNAHLVLVDAAGRIRGFYDANDAQAVRRLAADARLLLRRPQV